MIEINETEIIMVRKLALVMALSTTTLMFFIGMVNIKNIGLPISIPVIVVMFAIGFVVGTLLSENRNGVYPWTLIGGLIIAVISIVVITCVFSGIVLSVTGGLFKINTDLLIYSFSVCMIFSVIALNIAYNLDTVVQRIDIKMFKKEHCDQDLEYYDELNEDEFKPKTYHQ